MIEAFPLQWPIQHKRTPQSEKVHARFQTRFAEARDFALRELEKLGARSPVISSNIPLKKDGSLYTIPYGSVNYVDDTGIAIYFFFANEQKVLCCDAFLTLDDNMQAIAKSLEALRGLGRWKCSDMIEQAFTGFPALPEQASALPWWDIIGVDPNASEKEIRQAYWEKAKQLHPDNGGDIVAFHTLNIAYKQALSTLNISR